MSYTIDTSVWVSAFLIGEPFHERSKAFLAEVIRSGQEVVIPTTVYLEVVMAIGRRERKAEAQDQIAEYLLAMPDAQFVEIHYSRMLAIVRETSKLGLRGMDAILVGVAKEFDAELVTLDAELAERARVLVNVKKLER